MLTIKVSEFKAKCLAILDEVAETGEVVLILKQGRPVAQLVPPVSAGAGTSRDGRQGGAETSGDVPEPGLPDRRAAIARWQAVRAEMARDPRSFRELSPQQRQERLAQLRGVGQGLFSSSDELARRKAEEIELEERKCPWPIASLSP